MKIALLNSSFIKTDKAEKDKGHTGEFVAQSKYDFDFFNGIRHGNFGIFYVYGNLEVDFEGGGSLSYVCLTRYRIEPLTGIPDVGTLIEKAYNDAPIDFERLFLDFELVQFNSPLVDLWVPESREVLREKIGASISKRFHE